MQPCKNFQSRKINFQRHMLTVMNDHDKVHKTKDYNVLFFYNRRFSSLNIEDDFFEKNHTTRKQN